MWVEKNVCYLLSDLGYTVSKSVDLQRVFNDLYKKGLIEGSEYAMLQQKIKKFPSSDEQLEVC